MDKNGSTAKWIGIISGVILTLGFGSFLAAQAAIGRRVERNTDDIRNMETNQAVITTELVNINKKLDRLLGE